MHAFIRPARVRTGLGRAIRPSFAVKTADAVRQACGQSTSKYMVSLAAASGPGCRRDTATYAPLRPCIFRSEPVTLHRQCGANRAIASSWYVWPCRQPAGQRKAAPLRGYQANLRGSEWRSPMPVPMAQWVEFSIRASRARALRRSSPAFPSTTPLVSVVCITVIHGFIEGGT